MIIVNDPKINFVEESKRKEGISAFMRIRNGSDYLMESIMSVIDQVDEIICVFNNSIDNTEDILLYLEDKYPDKIKVYKYIPVVYAINTQSYLDTPEESIHSMAYYYKYTMSLTTYKYIFKFDDDELFFPGILRKCEEIIKNNPTSAIPLRGINLYDYDNKLYLNTNNLKTGGGDTLFFKYNKSCTFKKDVKYEYFISNLKNMDVIDAFYHTKRCKVDRGINNYDLSNNKKSRYIDTHKDIFNNINLIDFYKSDIFLENKIDPFDVGFSFRGNKKYNFDPITLMENNIKVKGVGMNRGIALKNLRDLDFIFRDTNSEYWLSCGTLLGLYRDGNFIGHDTDTDVCVNIESLNTDLLNKILDFGFSIIHCIGRYEDGFEISIGRDGVKTDMFFFYKKTDNWYHSVYSNFTKHDCLKHDYVFDKFGLKETEFLGYNFITPDDIESVLIQQYGESWDVVIEDWKYWISPNNLVNTNKRVNKSDAESDLKKILNNDK